MYQSSPKGEIIHTHAFINMINMYMGKRACLLVEHYVGQKPTQKQQKHKHQFGHLQPLVAYKCWYACTYEYTMVSKFANKSSSVWQLSCCRQSTTLTADFIFNEDEEAGQLVCCYFDFEFFLWLHHQQHVLLKRVWNVANQASRPSAER